MIFWKYQALGNDFIIVDSIAKPVKLTPSEIKLLCNRNLGIGSDGLMILEKGPKDAPYKMVFHNPDGSKAEMCGNGIRCFALYIHDQYDKKSKRLTIQTDAGIRDVRIQPGHDFKAVVSMGEPNFAFKAIPAEPSAIQSVENVIKGLDTDYSIVLVSVGNPHCVIFFNNVNINDIDIDSYGRNIENLPDFPKKTNVEFCNIIDRKNIKVRVWERGVGETSACGTGACAVAAASIRNNLADEEVKVRLPGGDLKVKWKINDEIYLAGPAEEVYKGEIGLGYVKERAKT